MVEMITGQEAGTVLITSRWRPLQSTSTSQSLTFYRKRGNITGSITAGNMDGLGGFSRSGLRSSGGVISDPGLGNIHRPPPPFFKENIYKYSPISSPTPPATANVNLLFPSPPTPRHGDFCQDDGWMGWSNVSVNKTRPTEESWSSWWRSSRISRWDYCILF